MLVEKLQSAGFEPAPLELLLKRALSIKLPPPGVEDNPQLAAHRNWSGSRDLHPDRLLHRERCCCYTTILISNGAPGRTRTDEYEFTKLAL